MPEQLVITEYSTAELLQLAEQGPPGPRGLAGAPGGALLELVAAAALSGHMAVAYDDAGQLAPASADDTAHALRLVGVTTGAAAAGAPALVQTRDVIEHSGWAWVPHQPVFLGLGAALVQAVPVGAAFCLLMGMALSPTRLLLNPQPAVFL